MEVLASAGIIALASLFVCVFPLAMAIVYAIWPSEQRLTLVRSRVWRLVGLVPVLYLAACVWANLLIAQPAVARFVLIGALLVALMAYRPQGLFGKQRVEIV